MADNEQTLWRRLLGLVRRDRTARRHGESDAPVDRAMATSRETGGGTDLDTQDANSTTGTTHNEEFVGRASGDESGDIGLSGAEARGDEADGATGAARA